MHDASVTIRLDNLAAGEYYVMYRPDFSVEHKARRLNLNFYSQFQPKMTPEELKTQEQLSRNMSEGQESALSMIKGRPKTAGTNNRRQRSEMSKQREANRIKNGLPPAGSYDPSLAIEFEKIEASSFSKTFFDEMEKISYDRYIEGTNYKLPEFDGEGLK